MIEVEVKLKIAEKDKVKRFLLEQGFTLHHFVKEEDRYFDNTSGAIRTSGQAMRIRRVTDMETGETFAQINFKGTKMDDRIMTREEQETEIADADSVEKILNHLGFYAVEQKVVKYRQQYCRKEMHACLDSVEGLGEFLELEILAERVEEKDKALDKIDWIISGLGDLVIEEMNISYLSQLQKLGD